MRFLVLPLVAFLFLVQSIRVKNAITSLEQEIAAEERLRRQLEEECELLQAEVDLRYSARHLLSLTLEERFKEFHFAHEELFFDCTNSSRSSISLPSPSECDDDSPRL